MVTENNENESELNEEPKIYNYISVIFENKWYPFDDPRILENADFRVEIYGNATKYTYKTDRFLKEGEVLKIKTKSGVSRVLVIKPSLSVEELTFPKDKVKELPLLEDWR
ncbi:MAG: hypothetical protein IJF92_00365 [Bacilli bacterium]|nr:hypothetical protein [Bacilli bacterium]MBQ3307559.1 hypothetical protein [Bacilli bacterium]